ncbi:hypothetical protein Pst134EB_027241 [Puccinia striiformis f. sp. tritici]|nr:hypothetical protein Pst134EB_027241 [Puccinia striiformis f. sp. tritici]
MAVTPCCLRRGLNLDSRVGYIPLSDNDHNLHAERRREENRGFGECKCSNCAREEAAAVIKFFHQLNVSNFDAGLRNPLEITKDPRIMTMVRMRKKGSHKGTCSYSGEMAKDLAEHLIYQFNQFYEGLLGAKVEFAPDLFFALAQAEAVAASIDQIRAGEVHNTTLLEWVIGGSTFDGQIKCLDEAITSWMESEYYDLKRVQRAQMDDKIEREGIRIRDAMAVQLATLEKEAAARREACILAKAAAKQVEKVRAAAEKAEKRLRAADDRAREKSLLLEERAAEKLRVAPEKKAAAVRAARDRSAATVAEQGRKVAAEFHALERDRQELEALASQMQPEQTNPCEEENPPNQTQPAQGLHDQAGAEETGLAQDGPAREQDNHPAGYQADPAAGRLRPLVAIVGEGSTSGDQQVLGLTSAKGNQQDHGPHHGAQGTTIEANKGKDNGREEKGRKRKLALDRNIVADKEKLAVYSRKRACADAQRTQREQAEAKVKHERREEVERKKIAAEETRASRKRAHVAKVIRTGQHQANVKEMRVSLGCGGTDGGPQGSSKGVPHNYPSSSS